MEYLWHTILDFAITITNLILLILLTYNGVIRFNILRKQQHPAELDFKSGSTIIEIQPLGWGDYIIVTEFNALTRKVSCAYKQFQLSDIQKIRIRNI